MLKQSISLVPARRDLYQAKLVFYLFIASLSMFFVASLVTYYLVRVQSFQSIQNVPSSPNLTCSSALARRPSLVSHSGPLSRHAPPPLRCSAHLAGLSRA